jgi:hypothetical protein
MAFRVANPLWRLVSTFARGSESATVASAGREFPHAASATSPDKQTKKDPLYSWRVRIVALPGALATLSKCDIPHSTCQTATKMGMSRGMLKMEEGLLRRPLRRPDKRKVVGVCFIDLAIMHGHRVRPAHKL